MIHHFPFPEQNILNIVLHAFPTQEELAQRSRGTQEITQYKWDPESHDLAMPLMQVSWLRRNSLRSHTYDFCSSVYNCQSSPLFYSGELTRTSTFKLWPSEYQRAIIISKIIISVKWNNFKKSMGTHCSIDISFIFNRYFIERIRLHKGDSTKGISLSIMSSTFIHIVAGDRITFLVRLNSIPLCITCHYFSFIHLSVDGHLGCF